MVQYKWVYVILFIISILSIIYGELYQPVYALSNNYNVYGLPDNMLWNCPIGRIRTEETTALEQEIMASFTKADLEIIVRLRVNFFYEHCRQFKEYGKYVVSFVLRENPNATHEQHIRLMREAMDDFHQQWAIKYKEFLLEILKQKNK